MVWAFLSCLTNILIVAALFVRVHLLAFLLRWWIYAASDSFSFCWISINQLTEVWISELQNFKCSKSLMSSQHLSEVRASVIKEWVIPFDLAWAHLVLLSPDRSPAVSISTSESSNCVVSFPWKIVISCNKVFVKFVCFWPEHSVSV